MEATAGIYTALRALDLEPFSEVIVGAVTDPGGLMPVPLLNLVPVIADTVPGSLPPALTRSRRPSRQRRVRLSCPHIAGEPADVASIVELAHQHGIPVIEDCSQAHAATLHGRPVGTFGDIGVFSTMFGKHHSVSGGQGGLVFTRDEALYRPVRRASDRGKPFFLPAGSTNVIASLNLNSAIRLPPWPCSCGSSLIPCDDDARSSQASAWPSVTGFCLNSGHDRRRTTQLVAPAYAISRCVRASHCGTRQPSAQP